MGRARTRKPEDVLESFTIDGHDDQLLDLANVGLHVTRFLSDNFGSDRERAEGNQRNQMDQIQDGGGTPWFNFSYDAAGNMIKRQAVYGGVNDSLNVPSQYYDALNRPTMWENTGSGDNAFARSWQQYDTVGRMTATCTR